MTRIKTTNNETTTTEPLADARELYRALSTLVEKIEGERRRGTPLSPVGRLGYMWDEDYPQELVSARDAVKKFKWKYSPAKIALESRFKREHCEAKSLQLEPTD